MVTLVNRAKVNTPTTGTGTITLGSAVDGYQTFASAGVANGNVVRYVIEDGTGWEIGTGTYTATGSTLTRTVIESSNGGAAISLGGDAFVYVGLLASDVVQVSDVGVTVQAHDADIVSDAAYVHTDNNYTTAEKSKLAGVEAGATADQTAAQILTAVKTVDGAASGLDADLLDGLHASSFLQGNQTITLSGDATGSGTTSIVVTVADDSHNHIISNVDGLQAALDGKLSTSGKAADSNLLDGIDSGSFLRSDATDTFTTLSGTTLTTDNLTVGSSAKVNFGNNDSMSYNDSDGVGAFSFNADAGAANALLKAGAATFSGLTVTGDIAVTGTVDGRDIAADGTKLNTIETGATADQTAAQLLAAIKTVDGAGSGLDADLLDGLSSASYLQEGGSHGTVTFSNWVRTTGSSGWYNASYGGGMFMQDSTWVRTYNSKQFHVSSTASNAIDTAGGVTCATVNGGVPSTAASAAGSIGSYAIAGIYAVGAYNFTQGGTYAGSSLKWGGAAVTGNTTNDGANSAGYPMTRSTTMSGSWRCMGATRRSSTGTHVTLFLRYQ